MFVIGCVVGIVSPAISDGWVDIVLMRLTDAQLSIPLIILAITILTVSRPTPLLGDPRAGAVAGGRSTRA